MSCFIIIIIIIIIITTKEGIVEDDICFYAYWSFEFSIYNFFINFAHFFISLTY